MEAKIVINMDNAAFDDQGEELSRILADLAEDLRQFSVFKAPHKRILVDLNGNSVGELKILR